MKIVSWNVNGIRAWYKKENCLNWILSNNVDIFCIQETKAEKEQLPLELVNLAGYCAYFESSKERKGHSGTAIFTKFKPEKVTFGLGKKEFDQQGRQINLFFKDFVLINCYFPNGGGPVERLNFKLRYYEEFLKFIIKIKKTGKKIVFCGDVNVAHNEIDLARPESNKKSVGFLPAERVWIDQFIQNDFVDVFREFFPTEIKYSWWDMKTRARDRNVGWRIDYFFVDKTILNKIKSVEIFDNVLGSDHAPIGIEIKL
ncbi:MAG TPA: exodeoxyribonuclease III [Candidatus Paceibacterota bacterium]|nr:exodeoxyribonuclease III [Candidatus Paceibacterota bacterium]